MTKSIYLLIFKIAKNSKTIILRMVYELMRLMKYLKTVKKGFGLLASKVPSGWTTNKL